MNDVKQSCPVEPQLSVIVVVVSDTIDGRQELSHLAGCLEALGRQSDPPLMEVTVPYKPPANGIGELGTRFPNVNFLPVQDLIQRRDIGGSREHHDELRARGLALARGWIVGLLEDHARPHPRWCAEMLAAHQTRYARHAAVGGAIENGANTLLSWAVYFCDFLKYQNPLPEGDSPFVSDANVSYKRVALAQIEPVWRAAFHETSVNMSLLSRGERIATTPKAVVFQHRSGLRLSNALKERFIWGRSYAATRAGLSGKKLAARYAFLSPAIPAVLVLRMARTVAARRRNRLTFAKALPITILLTICWALGELSGYLSSMADGAAACAGEPTDAGLSTTP